jgi:A/G-specific adenine glycosylase
MQGDPVEFRRRLLAWYDRHRRDLPWRVPPGTTGTLDPYHVLVSEAMLQQTQVATVIPYFRRFLEQFPTVSALAAADEQAVLRAWQGLGYYSRARNLHGSARRIMADHGGQVPSTVDGLLGLPGVGRYTAGAVASIAFDRRAPILDGNVARVLCRVDAVRSDPRDRVTRELLWTRAEAILPEAADVAPPRFGDFNSALMELGATVCTPRSPRCLVCPVRDHCEATAAGIQEQIPPPKAATPTPLLRRWTFCIAAGDRYLVEQRPPTGRWAGMWQFATAEGGTGKPTAKQVGERFAVAVGRLASIGQIEHALTHRRYVFDVYRCQVRGGAAADATPRRWVTLAELAELPLPRPQVLIMDLLRSASH